MLQTTAVRFDENGLVPAIVQDARTREVLTLAFMNEESLTLTLETNETWFWSRSRKKLWHKGETSGNTQQVVDISLDCDGDALVVLVEPAGPACHTGARSCFAHEENVAKGGGTLGALLSELYRVIESRERERPAGSYTSYLFNQGLDKILKKVGEESAETIIAAKNDEKSPLISEVSDLLYHLLVLLVARGVSLEDIRGELARRENTSGEPSGNKQQ
jgi:phosphoribosyl-AMP cyclohydrolase / phosphoribosyl-ATP pyrophosphohydrolase